MKQRSEPPTGDILTDQLTTQQIAPYTKEADLAFSARPILLKEYVQQLWRQLRGHPYNLWEVSCGGPCNSPVEKR